MSGPIPGPAAAARQESTTLSWRDRLAAKQRRRVTVPIVVTSDDGGLVAQVDQLRMTKQILEVTAGASQESLAAAQERLDDAEAQLAQHVVEIPFASLAPAEYDALMAAHPSTDPAEDGGTDWRAALPALAAACCDEPDGDDITFWEQTLASPEWTKADLLSLWGALLRLHTRAPSARVPFA